MRTSGRCNTVAPLPPKINAPEHDPRRAPLELRGLILPPRAGLDLLAQAVELGFAFAGARARAAFEVVEGGGGDGAGDLVRAVLHRELHDAAVLFVGDEAAGGEFHGEPLVV